MKIFIASDHAGFERKTKVIDYLKIQSKEVIDLGPSNDERVDYPDFANNVCESLKNTSDSIGILICGSGQGMAMRANKFSHIRAALCWNAEVAELSRGHNRANVLCLGSRLIEEQLTYKIIDTFLNTPFEGGRHQGRVDKISLPIKTS
ncbi:MAG: ribose 5-phosphate isomerase B [Bdellovibrionales bacterium]